MSAYNKNKLFDNLAVQNPEVHRFITETLLKEKVELANKPEPSNIDKCRLWVIQGVLDHSLSVELLKNIAGKYNKLGLVPNDYHYPEFYSNEM